VTESAGAPRPAIDDALRERLDELLTSLCSVASPSGSEAAVRDHVAGLCAAAGYDEQRTDSAGNLLARRRESVASTHPVVLCAHLDTVEHGATPIEPVLVDDGWENRNAAILGADNKAAIAVMLACVERVRPDVSLLFTTGEEQALAGAKACDPAWLEHATVYIYDHATPIGGIVLAAPTYYRLDAEFRGQAAHAGICPENGRSAIRAAARAVAKMPHGRLDPETTVNAAQLRGGATAGTNIVAASCSVVCEVRSRSPGRAEAVVAEIVDAFQDAANDPADPCDLTTQIEQLFAGYRHDPQSPAIDAARRALVRCGHRVELLESGGGSDANALLSNGVTAVCLANGTEAPHEPSERVSRTALADMAAVTFALLDELAG